MISKRIVFVVVFVFCFVFPRGMKAIEVKEVLLKGDKKCWTTSQEAINMVIYDDKVAGCSIEERSVIVDKTGEYCSLQKDNNGNYIKPYYQIIKTYSVDISDFELDTGRTDLCEGRTSADQPYACYCNCGEGVDRKCKLEYATSWNESLNECPTRGEVKFYPNNGNSPSQTYNGPFTIGGEEVCNGNNIIKCDKLSGTWNATDKNCDPDSQICVNYKVNSWQGMMAKCIGKDIDLPKCEGSNVIVYTGIGSYKRNVKDYLVDKGETVPDNCSVCKEVLIDNKLTISCRGEDEVFDGCTKTTTGVDLDDGKVGTFVCDSNTQILWKCNSKPYYDEEDNCPEIHKNDSEPKKTYCGFLRDPKDPSKRLNQLGCITKENYDQQISDGVQIPGSSITINTRTNDNFWCPGGHTEIRTAIGCIPIDINDLVKILLPTIFGIAGGIAFLMMVYGFIMVSTSSGDEKKMQEAQKTITSAITGLLVSLFALFLYRLIAVQILHIPGI